MRTAANWPHLVVFVGGGVAAGACMAGGVRGGGV